MVLEINLHDFIRQSEHDSMFSLQPFLNVGASSFGSLVEFLSVWLRRRRLQVRSEMLKQRNFLLQLFWILSQSVGRHNVLFFGRRKRFSLEIIKVLAVDVENNFSRVVEEDSRCTIGKQISKTVLA